jgi:hypothetical protein
MRGSAQHAGPLAILCSALLGLEFGDNARDNNPFRPERLIQQLDVGKRMIDESLKR